MLDVLKLFTLCVGLELILVGALLVGIWLYTVIRGRAQ